MSPNIPWSELLKNRHPMASTINSAHMLECMRIVQAKYPDAKIVDLGKDSKLWRLELDGEAISNPHNSHYACWIEVREMIDESGQ